MTIQSIKNYNFSQKNITFAKRHKKDVNKNIDSKAIENSVPSYKLVPAMMALAGLTTLNSCSDDILYREMDDFKNEVFEEITTNEKNLSKINEKTFVFSNEQDSVFKETEDYKYSHHRIKSTDHTRVFGDILRKQDGKELHFINVYDEQEKLTSTTLKDPKTNETFYVSYSQGFFDKVKDKNGNELPSSKYGDYLAILLLAAGLYGAGHAVSKASTPKMTNKDVPFIEPPQHKED